ncbi:MAG: hypothetical protein F6K10_27080 [Moorea sp. SIO2B7]|nr:hypothetical protein [Moorena sp. SIO2B7]
MSQDVSNKPETKQSLSSSVPLHSWSAESDADKLMDELFSDIDRILEGGSQLPTKPVESDYVSIQSVVIPPILVSNVEQKSGQLVPKPAPKSPKDKNKVKSDTGKDRHNKDNRGNGNYIDKILFAFACTSLLAVILWLVGKEKLKLPAYFNFEYLGKAVVQENQPSSADHEFIKYMLRSLEAIESKAETKQQQATKSPAKSSESLPPPPNPSNPSSASKSASTIIERIYIPVYPPNQNPTLVPPAPASTAPAPPPAPVPVAPPEIKPPPPPAPVITHILVGLLESGDNSAALFEINGSTHRIKVGEAIGSSGWTLVSVANQKAVIRRNGEVRSVYVGQKF